MSTKPRRVTIHDVAKHAGVSAQTVSRVLNDHPDVSEATRARVQRAIAELRYRPSAIARSLIKRASGMIGVVASGFHFFGPAQLLAGIERQATELGWQLMLQVATDPSDYDRVATTLIAQQVEGVIWAYPELSSDRERAFHQQLRPHAPILFLSMEAGSGEAVLSVDNRLGARLAVEHLIARGRRHIGLITGPLTLWSAQQRRLGWEDALASAGLPHTERQVVQGDWSAESGCRGLRALLQQYPELDAVFVSNDQMALGVLYAAHQLGLRVPKDLSVVGFDNMPESACFIPALTTVHQDLFALGQLAVREMDRVIRARRAGKQAAIAPLMLQPRLVVRESS
ncbi:MAG: LacI family transcriptional regulator [Thermoflexales bacterium]|nr:LacI family transcriptional regulator [Thermoflexales bacterium]MCS7325175.1 LacI family transcriptional regulator [Thermoflexales bacterium]MCX7938050.1 LacI family transcriptional regulator [Thermoflexales bacterium]MDW8053398.1 LacI family DNA-binding transcriptional regulator [Anaerolineae bacterium]MDW8292052.1 LacI family DNA-binding transcriptional regulator [Anaerolineae bacterium]